MTNVELKEKVEEIIAIEDYFDRAIAISNFDKEYRGSDFFKVTKKPLEEVIRGYRIDQVLSAKELTKKLQEAINSLNIDNLNSVLDNISTVFGTENEEVEDLLEKFKDLAK